MLYIYATNLSHNFALPQFMAQHKCEDLEPTATPTIVPTFITASSGHTFDPICAHNPITTQCNQSQYLTSLNHICAHNPSASHVSQANLSNSLASPCPPDPGKHVLKKSATDLGEQDFPVKWFKFMPRMTETSICTPVHVAWSHLASMNHQWTINLQDGCPPFYVLIPGK